MELETYYLEGFKEIRITEPSKEHHEEQAIPPPWKRIWVSKKGGKTTVVAISHTDHHSESRAKSKEQRSNVAVSAEEKCLNLLERRKLKFLT